MNVNAHAQDEKFDAIKTPAKRKSYNPLRSLVGKSVFLDLNFYKLVGKLRECLNLIEVVS